MSRFNDVMLSRGALKVTCYKFAMQIIDFTSFKNMIYNEM